jgi:hypothetical protein
MQCSVAAGKNLQAQYERWQPKAKYRMHLDPTVDDIKKLATGSRRGAKVCGQYSNRCNRTDLGQLYIS